MSAEITRAALAGAQISITPDCWPAIGKVQKIQVSMTKRTWNGMTTLTRHISAADMRPEQAEEAIIGTIREMAETIELPHNWKG